MEEKPVLEEFQFALVLKKKKRLDAGAPPYQNADTLIKMGSRPHRCGNRR
jgi:hypothetical protein